MTQRAPSQNVRCVFFFAWGPRQFFNASIMPCWTPQPARCFFPSAIAACAEGTERLPAPLKQVSCIPSCHEHADASDQCHKRRARRRPNRRARISKRGLYELEGPRFGTNPMHGRIGTWQTEIHESRESDVGRARTEPAPRGRGSRAKRGDLSCILFYFCRYRASRDFAPAGVYPFRHLGIDFLKYEYLDTTMRCTRKVLLGQVTLATRRHHLQRLKQRERFTSERRPCAAGQKSRERCHSTVSLKRDVHRHSLSSL